jgi:dihydrofolate reductase
MAASPDGFIARKDGRVDWLETSDEFIGGDSLDAAYVREHLVCGRRGCLRRMSSSGLADEIRCSILPILIGDGIPFFEKLGRDVTLHLTEVKAYNTGIVELCYDVRDKRGTVGSTGK